MSTCFRSFFKVLSVSVLGCGPRKPRKKKKKKKKAVFWPVIGVWTQHPGGEIGRSSSHFYAECTPRLKHTLVPGDSVADTPKKAVMSPQKTPFFQKVSNLTVKGHFWGSDIWAQDRQGTKRKVTQGPMKWDKKISPKCQTHFCGRLHFWKKKKKTVFWPCGGSRGGLTWALSLKPVLFF